MKIAQVAPLIESVPPQKYGGTERVVSALTEALVARGHEVTLFASGNSHTAAKLVSVIPEHARALYPKPHDRTLSTLVHLGTAYSNPSQFDIIHDHTTPFGGPFAQLSPTPTVVTLHGVVDAQVSTLYRRFTNPYLVTISNSQRNTAPDLDYTATIYNGLDFKKYPKPCKKENFLLSVGRICPQKGVHLAIHAAKKAGIPLIIAAKYEPLIDECREYFEKEIQPYLGRDIQFIGEVDQEKRNNLMSRAIASLHTATWNEPFGLTLIEAMACGCPVIALNHGSIPEVVKEGVSGFIVNTPEDIPDAIHKARTLSRESCARHAREQFSDEHMAQQYEELYKKILALRLPTSIHQGRQTSWRFGSKFSQLYYTD